MAYGQVYPGTALSGSQIFPGMKFEVMTCKKRQDKMMFVQGSRQCDPEDWQRWATAGTVWVSFQIALWAPCGHLWALVGRQDLKMTKRLFVCWIFDAICAACGCPLLIWMLCFQGSPSLALGCGFQPLRFLKQKQHVMLKLERGWVQLQNSEKRTRTLAGTLGGVADNLNER